MRKQNGGIDSVAKETNDGENYGRGECSQYPSVHLINLQTLYTQSDHVRPCRTGHCLNSADQCVSTAQCTQELSFALPRHAMRRRRELLKGGEHVKNRICLLACRSPA